MGNRDGGGILGLYSFFGTTIAGGLGFMFFVWWFAFSYARFMDIVANLNSSTFDRRIIIGLFVYIETDPGNADDVALKQTIITTLVLIYTQALHLLYTYPEYIASKAVLSSLGILISILLFPTILCTLLGAYTMNYLRGGSESNSTLYCGVFDLANLFGFIIRPLVQLVRYTTAVYTLIMVRAGLLYYRHLRDIQGESMILDFRLKKTINGGFIETLLEGIHHYVVYL
jgi:hypothetical protein